MLTKQKLIPWLKIFGLLTVCLSFSACALPFSQSATPVKNSQTSSPAGQPALTEKQIDNPNTNPSSSKLATTTSPLVWHLKAVPVDVSPADLALIKESGFTVLSTEWGLADVAPAAVKSLLDRLQDQGLKIILDGGFSAGAWGYSEDTDNRANSKPVWQKDKVVAWINQFKNHPALYGWDISNEAGENLTADDTLRLTLDQLQTAAHTVRLADPRHPVIIRMHYWDDYDGDFGAKNPFAENIADIVILNLYSNYSEDGKQILLPDMVADSGQTLVNKILTVDPKVKIWLCLAAFSDPPMFLRPTPENLQRDIKAALKIKGLESLGFFGWGSPDDNWYLPRDSAPLLKTIQNLII